jgi:SnoaL-like protein
MCDYSLQNVRSRPAKVGDKLTTRDEQPHVSPPSKDAVLMVRLRLKLRHLRTLFVMALLAGALAALATVTGAVAADGDGPGLSVSDRLDILDLYARYSQDLDNGNADDFVTNVFAPNGTFHDPSNCDVGSDQLRQLALTFGKPFQDHHEQHLPYNIVLEGHGDHATGHAYVSVLNQSLDGGLAGANPHIFVMGTYTDTFVKLNGKWLILDREVWRLGPITAFPACPTDINSLK